MSMISQGRVQIDDWRVIIHILLFCLITFFFKSIVFKIYEHEYMNNCPPLLATIDLRTAL